MKKIREKRVKNNNSNGIPTPRFPKQSEKKKCINRYKNIKIQKITPKRAIDRLKVPELSIFREVCKAPRRKSRIEF